MVQKFIISRFRREAGLFFFTINFIIILFLTNGFGLYQDAGSMVLADEDDPIIVVIDPGHGGDDQGGVFEDFTEKELNLAVAKAMKAELEQYEGINVYLTRTEDTALILRERSDYAVSVDADFLFCLHFNTSDYHTLFGAETWISAFGEEYSKGYAFASIEMEMLKDLGLYSRGIKTRLNDKGEDYYGIIRFSREKGLPCVLIEHCHIDQENDMPFCDKKDKLEALGRLDAEAVAKYFGLYSESLGKDFRNYSNLTVPVPTQPISPDKTKPDICMIELIKQNDNNGEVTVSVSAADYDSGMLYYDYSYDGGMTFSELKRWPDRTKDTFEFTITVPPGIIPQIIVNAYNGYDLYTTSNTLHLSSMNYQIKSEEMIPPESSEYSEDVEDMEITEGLDGPEIKSVEASSDKMVSGDDRQESKNMEQPITIAYFIKVCLICLVLVLAMALSIVYILRSYKRKKRKRKNK